MKVVLDTCALLALAAGDLSTHAVSEIRRADQASVSSEHYELREVHLDAELAGAAAALPKIHRDPFDRAIVALARATDSVLITSDERMGQYPGVTLRW